MKKVALLVSVFSVIFVFSCGKNSKVDPIKTVGFDRKVMLTNFAENLIIPKYNKFESSLQKLSKTVNDFSEMPTTENLITAQYAWDDAYTFWMEVNAYNFGPAGEDGIKKGLIEEIGTFPISETKIENVITKNNANFNDFNRDARGLLAVEYLLFDLKGNEAVIKKMADNNRFLYLKALLKDINNRVTLVISGWKTYKNEFIANAGTDVGSSTAQVYNEFVRSFESIKNFKLGLPIGLRAGQVKPEPTKLEAFYSRKTLKYLERHFRGIEAIWLGEGENATSLVEGVGFKDYLNTVEGGKELVVATEIQLKKIKNAIEEIPQNISIESQIINNPTKLTALHTELQKNTRFFKSDMSSILGIAITFSSGDGD